MARPIRKLKDIETAAVRLFAQRGVGRVTTKDISKEAGTAEGAFYRHYSGIEDLAFSLYKREVEKFGTQLKALLDSDISYEERIRKSVSLFYSFFDQDRITFAFILLSQHQFSSDRKINPRLNPEVLVFAFIQEGIQSGAFAQADANLACAMVLGLVLTPATRRVTGKLKGTMIDRVDSVAEACLQVLQTGGRHVDNQSNLTRKPQRARTGGHPKKHV